MSNGNGTTTVTLPLFNFDSSIVPDIDFCVKDASQIESDVISNYERAYLLGTQVSKTLGRGDPVRLLLLTLIYQLVVQRSIVDSTGKENLLKYSHGDDLENIGAMYGKRGLRLKATYATTTLQFSVANALTTDCPIPAGTLAQTGSQLRFATSAAANIPAGSISVTVGAKALETGETYNGLVAGQINQLVSWKSPFLVSVTNTDTSGGGASVEADPHLRARIWMAPESFSTAGPKEAYMYWAASANPDIIDVSVWSDAAHAGQVYIYPLMTGGTLPDEAVLDQVYATCNADDIRPLTDQVFVQSPIVSDFVATVEFWIDKTKAQFEDDTRNAVMTAYENWVSWQSSKIGLDINPSKLDQMMVDAGAKRTVITSPVFTVIDAQTLAVCDRPASLCTYMGLEEQ
jgi:phage-related baseplate assembly protein